MSEYNVFLSHNSADKPAVEELARRLVKEGIQPWLDTWNLIPGEPWQEAIEEALARCATCAVFVGPSGTGPWQNEEMRAAIDRRVRESQCRFRVIPVLLPGAERGERSRLPTFLVATTWVEFRRSLDDEDAFHRLACGIRGVEPGPGPGQAIYEGECPYRGLQFFDVEHAPFFFGREALTGWLLDALRGDNRFLAIIGPSGSGKSSLARAGLVAALKRSEIEDSADWPVLICRPGPDPLESLAVGLSQDTSDALALISRLSDDERALHITARMTLRDAPPERRLVVLVDQFEELFTLCHDEGSRQAFIDNLLYAANVAQGRTLVLLALRADFYGKCAIYPSLAATLSDYQVLVGPMTDSELQRSIRRPAQLVGAEFETGLVQTLIRDVEGQPGGLPLLQQALLELWQLRKGRKLTHEVYQAMGGIEAALNRRAEMIFGQLTKSEQETCRRLFLRLIQPGEGTEDTKRRASVQELLPAEGPTEQVEAVITKLTSAEARLLIAEGDKTFREQRSVEIAHEALIHGWPRLQGWIDESKASLRIHRRLTAAANEWTMTSGDESFLYRGLRLAEAQEWAKAHEGDLNELEQAFLNASQSALEEAERQRVDARRAAERLYQLELVHQMIQKTAESDTESTQMLEIVAQTTADISHGELTTIFSYDSNSQCFTDGVRLWRGQSVEQLGPDDLPASDDLPARIALDQNPIFAADIERDSESVVASGLVIGRDFRAFAGLPLTFASATVAVLLVHFQEPRRFSDDEQRILRYLTDQAAIVFNLRNAEQSGQLKRSDAEALMGAWGAWGADLAHDINREVGAIRWATFTLSQRPDLPPDVKERLHDIDHRAARLALPELPTGALESTGIPEFNKAPLLDRVILAEIRELQAASPSVTLKPELGCDGIRVAIHEMWLCRMVRHLVRNSIKALPSSKETLQVAVRTIAQGNVAEVQVRDTGKGVRPEIEGLLFRKAIPHPDGPAGRGLLLVRYLAEQHGGYAKLVWSKPGEGACFAFAIPLAH